VNLISYRGYSFQNPPPEPGNDTPPKPDYGHNTEIVETVTLRLGAVSLGLTPGAPLTVERIELPPLPKDGPPQVALQPYRWEDGFLVTEVPLAQVRLVTLSIRP